MNKLARIPAEVHSMSDMDDWFVGYGIWQLKQLDQDEVNANGFPDDYWGFMDYDFALEHGFSKDAYEFVYFGWLMVDRSDVQSDGRESEFVGDVDGLLERVFETLNVNRPSDFTGHSLSMSDIVVLGDEAYYVDRFGFKRLAGLGMWASRTASAPYASAEQMLLQVADRFEPGKWWSINWGASYSLGIIHADDEDDFLCQAENLLLNSGSMGQQDFSRYYVYGPQDSPDGFQGVALASRVAQETTVGDDPRRAALRQSLEGENKAIYDYQNWIDQLPDGDDVRIQLESIRDEEQAHIGELSQLLFELYPDEKNNFSDGQSEVTSTKNGSASSQAFDADGVTVVVEPEFANGYVRIEMYEQANTDRHGNGLLLDMTVDFNSSVDDPYTDYIYTTTPTFNQDGTIDCEYMAFVRDVNGYGTKEFDGSFVASDLPSSFDELLMEPEFRSIYDEMLAEAKAEALSRSTGVTARRVGGRKTAELENLYVRTIHVCSDYGEQEETGTVLTDGFGHVFGQLSWGEDKEFTGPDDARTSVVSPETFEAARKWVDDECEAYMEDVREIAEERPDVDVYSGTKTYPGAPVVEAGRKVADAERILLCNEHNVCIDIDETAYAKHPVDIDDREELDAIGQVATEDMSVYEDDYTDVYFDVDGISCTAHYVEDEDTVYVKVHAS